MPPGISRTSNNRLTYAAAGVDISAGNDLVEKIKPLAAATKRPGSLGGIGGFGGLFDLKAAGYRDPLLVAANDGVGTKLKVAIAADRHEEVGIDLVAMCVNDLVVQGAEPLFFLDYFATGKLEVEKAAAIVTGIAEGCRQAGCALLGGETAEMPGLYAGDDYDLAGFAVGAVERDQVLTGTAVRAGDKVLGLASSGLHSNGFSLVRRIVEVAGLDYGTEAPFEPGAKPGGGALAADHGSMFAPSWLWRQHKGLARPGPYHRRWLFREFTPGPTRRSGNSPARRDLALAAGLLLVGPHGRDRRPRNASHI